MVPSTILLISEMFDGHGGSHDGFNIGCNKRMLIILTALEIGSNLLEYISMPDVSE